MHRKPLSILSSGLGNGPQLHGDAGTWSKTLRTALHKAATAILLKGIAGQMAIVREVLQLKKSVNDERRARVQVLGHLDRQQVQLLTECPDCGRCYTTAESTCANDGVSLSMTLPVERTIDGKYLLERRIGRGGMGVVYRARDVRLNRQVAIKMMVGDLFGNSAAVSRFSREARAVAGLSHPNIVAVYDFGSLPAGGAYLVMEAIHGESWRKHLTPGRGMTLQQAYTSIRQLCLAAEAAHTGGVIHRDLKPENIMIAEDVEPWRVVVLDFGLAKFRAEMMPADPSLTVAGTIHGKPRLHVARATLRAGGRSEYRRVFGSGDLRGDADRQAAAQIRSLSRVVEIRVPRRVAGPGAIGSRA